MDWREWRTPAVAWLVLTVVGEAALGDGWFLPEGYAREADVSREAFLLLARLAVPVSAFVVVGVVFAVLRYRSRGRPVGDGPPLRGTSRTFGWWLGVTGALALLLIVHPGLTGLADIRGEASEDLVVEVDAARWFWSISYPEHGVTVNDEMVLPVGQRVRFDVTSIDVIHSFWIPGFAMKIDAVPGRTTVARVTPERTGSEADDSKLRLQCAELCGIGHAAMRVPVRVVEADEFETWLRERAAGDGASGSSGATSAVGGAAVDCGPPADTVTIRAEDVAFDTKCLAAEADRPFTITFANNEAVPHNVSIFRDDGATELVFEGDTFTGPAERVYEVGALPAGTYFYRCDLHPIPAMSGTLVVTEP